ncbi:nucleotidyltransferase [Corallococcus sp. M34]|uniref:SMODS domain-containing nucleotidyltransferase n=1 Tax=Citreicoccus inhibens TaxID=2849499 RepID=UPI001C23C131|nr:nucleotidyltransferase [Citreicoccus inhibens]MBU8900965.1 nucleotidyltransferase [Citreicoccus inhibens]
MELPTDFKEFLQEIRPTEHQRSDLQTGHKTLRDRLTADEDLNKCFLSDFLQGSYRRATAIRPKGDRRSDVDIIIVTKLSEREYTPAKAMDLFKPFLNKYYKGKWRQQGRSFGIEMHYVELDLVLTSAPSEAEVGILRSDAVTSDDDLEEAKDWRLHRSWVALGSRYRSDAKNLLAEAKGQDEWKAQPLHIPDRDANKWEPTHPLAQIAWTRDKTARTDGHFVNVVKAIKWWRVENYEEPKHPKGFPLERLIGECCPDGITSVAEGIVKTLEKIVSQYALTVLTGGKPSLPDYGVSTHDVFKRISADDFKKFYDQAKTGADLARRAYDSEDRTESGNLWRELFGSKFPKPPECGGGGSGGSSRRGFTPPTGPAVPGSGRFA